MATAAPPPSKLDRYVVIHVATTCDEHGVYVTKDSAEVIELGWILLDSKTCDEVSASDDWVSEWKKKRRTRQKQSRSEVLTSGPDLSRECPGQAGQHPHHAPLQ